jgi:putative phosphoesterase
MRVAVLNDIHGNLPALEAVLLEMRTAKIDRVVVGGDVFPGPMARDVLDRLRALPMPVDFIYGNCEVALLETIDGKPPSKMPPSFVPIMQWHARQLGDEDRQFVRGWPMTMRLTVPPLGDVVFCHATPRDWNECFVRTTPEEKLRPIIDAANAAVVVCGHTHMPFDRMVGKTRVVNTGSVGMPFGPAGADWLILGPDVDLRHANYDLHAAADRVRHSGYPTAEEFADKYVVNPPSASDMLAVFSRAELQ